MPSPPLTPQTKLDACIQTFLLVLTLYRVGGGEGGRPAKGSTILWGNPKIYRKILILHYSPKNFCLIVWLCSFKELLQENEENCGKHILVVIYLGIVNHYPPSVHPRPHRHRFRLFEIKSNQDIFFFPGSVERKPLLLDWSFLLSPLQSLFYFREICQIQVTSQYSPTCFSNYGNQESMTIWAPVEIQI